MDCKERGMETEEKIQGEYVLYNTTNNYNLKNAFSNVYRKQQ